MRLLYIFCIIRSSSVDSPAGLAGLFLISFKLCESLCDGCQQHFTGAAVDIDQAFSGGCRANQRLAGPFYGKIQTAAPGDGKIAVNLQNVIVQLDFHQFLFGTSGFQAQDTIALDTQIEEAFIAKLQKTGSNA